MKQKSNCATGTVVVAAAEERELVVEEPTTAAGENRRPSDQARSLLLAAVGREPSYAAPVWKHDAANRSAAAAGRLAKQERG